MEGAKQLWEMCPDHPSLARILNFGIKQCNIYVVRTPRFARRGIAERGSAEADVTTLTTPLEMWESAGRCDDKFESVRAETHLGLMSLFEAMRYEVACHSYRGRWPNKNRFLKTCSFFLGAQSVDVTSGPYAGQTL